MVIWSMGIIVLWYLQPITDRRHHVLVGLYWSVQHSLTNGDLCRFKILGAKMFPRLSAFLKTNAGCSDDKSCGKRSCCFLKYVVFLMLICSLWYGVTWHSTLYCKSQMLYDKPNILKSLRSDVLVMTPWFAPIVWNGTYNIEILKAQFHKRDVRIGLTVFAIKRYTVFIQTFIETAEKYFMAGCKVNYYVFTDHVRDIPNIALGEGRQLVILEAPSHQRWQEVSMRRMEMIRDYSRQRFVNEVDYLVCVDVDMRFSDDVGVEILSDLFGTLHPGLYGLSREGFTYERRQESTAYIPGDEGDFYYAGGFFGGIVEEVYKLTNFCHIAMMTDKKNEIEAIWHDESYLNKYFLYHKPTRILSPEYLWENGYGVPRFLKRRRFVAVPKNHKAIRNRRALQYYLKDTHK
ncbi:histo-blood group ABO system transferase-like isoform X2 [Mixophyes fleayi]|uniref:histo-blood group ABO system transferase-like isoform X2 n=1 Tax=Mixophyes fleayi TaxID=3061075 RepID=UPI003F4E43DE